MLIRQMFACMCCHTRGSRNPRRWRRWEGKIIPLLCYCRCVMTTLQYFMTADLSACPLLFQRRKKHLRVQRSGWSSKTLGGFAGSVLSCVGARAAWSCGVLTFPLFMGCLPCRLRGCDGRRRRGYRCESLGVVLIFDALRLFGVLPPSEGSVRVASLAALRWWRLLRQRRFCRNC
jgi:hypothetical protein